MPVVDHFAGEKDSRLTIVDGCQPVESVYVNLRTAVLPNIRQEIVEVTQRDFDGQSASITYDLQQQEVRYSISLYIYT
jgi:septum formation topological specificity factor MinE